MDNFDIKKFVSSKSLLNENSPGFDTRKAGEALPTLASVKAAYEAKNGINEADAGKTLFDLIGDLEKAIKLKDEDALRNKIEGLITKYKKVKISEYSNLNEGMRGGKSELDKRLAEIDKEGAVTTLEAKIAAIDETIESKTSRINMVQEDENLSELIDKKRVKGMQKEIKLLERSKKVYEKQLDKANGVKTEKVEKKIVDEYNTEPHNAPDASADSTMDEKKYYEEYKY